MAARRTSWREEERERERAGRGQGGTEERRASGKAARWECALGGGAAGGAPQMPRPPTPACSGIDPGHARAGAEGVVAPPRPSAPPLLFFTLFFFYLVAVVEQGLGHQGGRQGGHQAGARLGLGGDGEGVAHSLWGGGEREAGVVSGGRAARRKREHSLTKLEKKNGRGRAARGGCLRAPRAPPCHTPQRHCPREGALPSSPFSLTRSALSRSSLARGGGARLWARARPAAGVSAPPPPPGGAGGDVVAAASAAAAPSGGGAGGAPRRGGIVCGGCGGVVVLGGRRWERRAGARAPGKEK